MTCLATGAANAAPWPGTPWRVTAIATVGSAAGAKAMNHTLLIAVPICVSAVPVLPATLTPGICASVPVPSLTTPSIMVVTAFAVEGFITTDCTRGEIAFDGAPFGVDDAFGQMRDHQPPAICHSRGDLRHLQRNDVEFVLADAHPPHVDERARGRQQV